MAVDFVVVVCRIEKVPRPVSPFDALRVPALRVQIDIMDSCSLAIPITVALIRFGNVVPDVLGETVSIL
jgi:hypothetical protein